MTQPLNWYLQRLRAMSIQEIGTRVVHSLRKEAWRTRREWVAPSPKFRPTPPWPLDTSLLANDDESKRIVLEAQEYLGGRYTFLSVPTHEKEMDWHLDPQTGRRAPLDFGPHIDYRSPELVGNVKNIWEKNRHHHLTLLAAAYVVAKDEAYADCVADQLASWVAQNPVPRGVNWASSLELGIRLISWVWIERLLRDSPRHAELFGEDGLMWPVIYWHQWFVSKHFSVGSSANNHLIGEMTGLYLAATAWPFFDQSMRWAAMAKQVLERAAQAQIFPSGLNREQAFSYHLFSLEFFLLAGLAGDRHSQPFSSTFKATVRRMLEVIPLVTDMAGNLPNYGDGDEGMACLLRPSKSSRVDWLYRLGRSWLGARLPQPTGSSGLVAATLIGSALGGSNTDEVLPAGSVGFEDAGLYVMCVRRGMSDEILCLADAGSLGYLSIAAHGHADALSFTLNIGGVPVIVDPGTYTYHADPVWRHFFRSTKAHNTIEVDGTDQSTSGGAFLWLRKAETVVRSWTPLSDGGRLTAEHYGYTRLTGGRVVHRRTTALQGCSLEIIDELTGAGYHALEWRLHFGPECEVHLDGDVCRVSWGVGELTLALEPALQWRIARGAEDGGWYSSGFNCKQPISTLVGSGSLTLPVAMKHVLVVDALTRRGHR